MFAWYLSTTAPLTNLNLWLRKSEEEMSAFVSDYELVKVNDHKSVLLVNCTDMEALQAFMITPGMKQWDEENGCVDTVYSMERIN